MGHYPERTALYLILIATLIKGWLAWWLPLGVDEAYAIAVAREFSWSFFDHPPIGFWLAVGMAKLAGIEHPLIYRLPYVLLGALTGLALYRIGLLLGGERAGLWTLILYLVAPHMALGSGLFVLPDAPLNAAGAALGLVLLLIMRRSSPAPLSLWLLAGALLAVALASKYQAGLLPLAVLGFALSTPGRREWLGQPGPWLAAVIGLIGLLPVLIWNLQHDWASFAFHGGRVGSGINPLNLAVMTLGQAGYLLPPVLVLAVMGLIRAGGRGAREEERLLLWLALLPIGAFMPVYLFGSATLPHWTMPGWLFALPLAGLWLAGQAPTSLRRARRWLAGFALPVWLCLVVVAIHIPTGILTRSLAATPAWDKPSAIFDWSALEPQLREVDWLEDVEMIVARDWISGGQISSALAGRYPLRVIGGRPHHFAYMAAEGRQAPALFLVPATPKEVEKRMAAAVKSAIGAGATVSRLGIVNLPRGGRDYAAVGVLRLDWPPSDE